jgi:trimethylamine--corrinoid protein Co-methyltransferase
MARDGSRRRGRQRRDNSAPAQLPLRGLRNSYRPIEVLSADQIEAIHDASMRILEEIGMEFLHPEALDILAETGAEV